MGQGLVDSPQLSPQSSPQKLSPPTKKMAQQKSNFNIKTLIQTVPHAPPQVKIEDMEEQTISSASYNFNLL